MPKKNRHTTSVALKKFADELTCQESQKQDVLAKQRSYVTKVSHKGEGGEGSQASSPALKILNLMRRYRIKLYVGLI